MLWNCFMVRMFLIWPSVKLIHFLLMGNIGKMASAAGQSCKIWLYENMIKLVNFKVFINPRWPSPHDQDLEP